MLQILLLVILIVVVAYAAFWLIDQAGTPAPFNMLLKLVVGLIALVALLERSGLLAGTGL